MPTRPRKMPGPRLERSDDPEVTWLAGVMDQGQQAEIRAMEDLLTRLN